MLNICRMIKICTIIILTYARGFPANWTHRRRSFNNSWLKQKPRNLKSALNGITQFENHHLTIQFPTTLLSFQSWRFNSPINKKILKKKTFQHGKAIEVLKRNWNFSIEISTDYLWCKNDFYKKRIENDFKWINFPAFLYVHRGMLSSHAMALVSEKQFISDSS